MQWTAEWAEKYFNKASHMYYTTHRAIFLETIAYLQSIIIRLCPGFIILLEAGILIILIENLSHILRNFKLSHT